MNTILICGYRRTGKDTLYSILTTSPTSVDRFKWRIYHRMNQSTQISKQFDCMNYERIAFADILKREASDIYGIPMQVSDADKDIKQFVHYQTHELVSARDIYIEHGRIRREQDPEYWCKAAFANKTNTIVTDWRYHNEAAYAINHIDNVLTIRIYRSAVPEPDSSIDSEHDLDTYLTDFLLLPDGIEDEFNKAIIKFPQYINYVEGTCL
jgi:hypothetical protein